MEFINKKHEIEVYLLKQGFILVDSHYDKQAVWRQKDDDPKMDIVIEFVEHKDNL